MFAHFSQDCLGLPDKDASIPYIMTIFQISLCRCQVRLFYEAFGLVCIMTIPFAHLIPKADIAVAGLWPGRCQSDCDQVTFLCLVASQMQCLPEGFDILNNVICTKNSEYGLRVLAHNCFCCPADC